MVSDITLNKKPSFLLWCQWITLHRVDTKTGTMSSILKTWRSCFENQKLQTEKLFGCFHQRRLCFRHLLVGLWGRLNKNNWMDSHKTWMEDRLQLRIDLFNFCCRSGLRDGSKTFSHFLQNYEIISGFFFTFSENSAWIWCISGAWYLRVGTIWYISK